MHLDDFPAPGALVQEVDVLRHDRLDEAEPLELGERQVSGVRLGLDEHRHARLVEAPHLDRVAAERVDRAVLERVEARPEAGRRAEVGDAALCADARPRQDDAGLPLPDQLGELHAQPLPA